MNKYVLFTKIYIWDIKKHPKIVLIDGNNTQKSNHNTAKREQKAYIEEIQTLYKN